MDRADTHTLLESIASLTRQRDSDDFRISLLKTVLEAIPARRVRILRPQTAGHGGGWTEEFRGLAQTTAAGKRELRFGSGTRISGDAWLQRCAEEGSALQVMETGEHGRYLVPVHDGESVAEVIDVETDAAQPGDYRLTKVIVQLYQNYLDLARAGERDTLTGLLNRRTLEARVSRILQAPRPSASASLPPPTAVPRRGSDRPTEALRRLSYWLAVIDIDHFKQINDRFGHLFGDEVLLLMARLMRHCFRLEDLLFRFGGEEFVVIVQAEHEQQAMSTFERFRTTVANHRFPQLDHVTVSIGYVCLDGQAVSGDAIGHADQALYFAKKNGRNRCCSYEQLCTQHALEAAAQNSEVELF